MTKIQRATFIIVVAIEAINLKNSQIKPMMTMIMPIRTKVEVTKAISEVILLYFIRGKPHYKGDLSGVKGRNEKITTMAEKSRAKHMANTPADMSIILKKTVAMAEIGKMLKKYAPSELNTMYGGISSALKTVEDKAQMYRSP